MPIQVKYTDEFKLTKNSDYDAGYDICSTIDKTIAPGESKLIPTGVSIAMPEHLYCRVAPRSGLAYKHNIDIHAGVIDASYRGDVGVLLFNHGKEPYQVKRGDRVAQLIFTVISVDELREVDELSYTIRGQGGFGSSGY